MGKKRQLATGRFLVVLNLAWFSLFALLLAANGWQSAQRTSQARIIKTLNAELRRRAYVQVKAEAKIADVPQLEFLAQNMMTRDPYFYAIAKAAWKFGPRLEKWPQVRNGGKLIMAISHRESLHGRHLRSFKVKRDQDGQPVLNESGKPVRIPVAYGPMQVHYAVWKDELQLDRQRLDDPEYSVEIAVEILLRYLDKHSGDISAALFDYWGGALAGGRYDYPPLVLESKYFDVHSPMSEVLR